jgi:hypothetical protein
MHVHVLTAVILHTLVVPHAILGGGIGVQQEGPTEIRIPSADPIRSSNADADVSAAYFRAWSSFNLRRDSLNHQLSEVASIAHPMKGKS